MIACLFLMGYDGPKGDSGGLRLEIQEWNVEKKTEKQYRIFEPFFSNSASKVEFLSTELFWS